MTAGNSGLLDGLKRISGKFRELVIDGGPPGAPLGYRLRGGTSYGAPQKGTWRPGDMVPDRAGNIWICTAGGTAGTWAGTAAAANATDWINVKTAYGAKGDGKTIAAGISASGTTLTATTSVFTSADVGKLMLVYGAGLIPAPAAAPALSQAAGTSTIASGTYQVTYTFVNGAGETTASPSASIVIASSNTDTITIPSPPTQQTVTGWYAYVTQAGGSTYHRQQGSGSPTAIGTALTLSAPPGSSGATPPGSSTATGGALSTTISAYTSGTQVTLTAAAAVTVSDVVAVFGTDDTTALQDAYNAAPGVVYHPYATYMISGALTVPNLAILQGAGCGYQYGAETPEGTVSCIVQTSLTADCLVTTATAPAPDSYAVTVKDLTLQGPACGSGYGMSVQQYGGNQNVALYLERLLISSFGSDGFNGQYLNFSSMRDVAFANNGGNGFWLLAQGIDLSNLHSFSNMGDGYYLYQSAGVANMLFTNENAGVGIHGNTVGGITFSGCTTENDASVNGATYFEGDCQGITLIGHSTSFNKYYGVHFGPQCYAVNVLSYTETVAEGFTPTASLYAEDGSTGFIHGLNTVTAPSIPGGYWDYDTQPGMYFGGAVTLESPLATTGGGSGGDYASLAALLTALLAAGGGTMGGALAPKVTALTDGSSVALNAANGNEYAWTLGGSSHTLAAPSNPADGQVIRIRIKYSGSYTPLFNSVFDFGTGGQPTWTATSGKTDIAGFEYDAALNGAAGEWAYLGAQLGLKS